MSSIGFVYLSSMIWPKDSVKVSYQSVVLVVVCLGEFAWERNDQRPFSEERQHLTDRYWPKEVDKEQRPQWVENLQNSRLVRHYYGHGGSCEMNEIRLLLEFPLVTKMGRYLRGSVK